MACFAAVGAIVLLPWYAARVLFYGFAGAPQEDAAKVPWAVGLGLFAVGCVIAILIFTFIGERLAPIIAAAIKS